MGEHAWTLVDPPFDAAQLVAASPLLKGLGAPELAAVEQAVSWVALPGGADLFAEGDAADAAYVLVRGRLDIHGDGRLIAQRGPGEIIGEAGLLGSGTRLATVTAVRDSLLARFEDQQFDELARSYPGVARHLAAVVAERLATRPQSAVHLRAPRLVAVVSFVGSLSSDELASDLERLAPERCVVASIASSQVASWIERGEVDRRLVEAESVNDLVLLALDRTADDHSAVLRQADLVVVVVPPGQLESPVERFVAGQVRPVELIVARRSGARPSGVAWHGTMSHLQRGDDTDVARLARRLTGRSIGLVLGGGGARGFAHIGVVRSLREAGIPIDRVGGSSMGAIIGAQVAMGWSCEEMLERNRQWSRRLLAEPAVPTVSFARGQRAASLIRSFFDDRCIEDLPLEFFCTTADLTSYRLHVADRGPVADWVAASAAVPGLWPPFVDARGHLHADGGVLDNVPTAVIRERSVGPVIAVDVCARQAEMLAPPSDSDALAPLRVPLRQLWRRGVSRSPGVLDLMNRSNLLASLQTWERARGHADLYLTPETDPYGFGSFDRVEELAEAGYRSAVLQLASVDLDALGVH